MKGSLGRSNRPIEYNIFKAVFGLGIIFAFYLFFVTLGSDKSHPPNVQVSAVLQQKINRTSSPTPTPTPIPSNTTTNEVFDNDNCDVKVQNITFDKYCEYVSNPNNTGCNNPYIKLQYCGFQKVQPLYFIILILFIGLAIFLLGDTCSNYLLPSLVVISKMLHLPPHVAGVTFLALGNASPNIVSMLISTIQRKPSLALNANISGELFVCCVVMGTATILANVSGLNRRPFIRDTTLSLCSYFFCFYMSVTNRSRVFDGVISILIWCFYVLVVVLGREVRKLWNKWRSRSKASLQNIELEEQMISNVDRVDQESVMDNPDDQPILDEEQKINLIKDKQDRDWEGGWYVLKKRRFTVRDREAAVVTTIKSEPPPTQQSNTNINPLNNVIEEYIPVEYPDDSELFQKEEKIHVIRRFFNYVVHYSGWNNMKWYEKVMYVTVLWYCNFIRNLTIFRSEREDWSRFFTVLVPMFAPLAVITAYDFNYWTFMINGKFPLVVLLVLCCSVFSLIILLTTRTDRPPIYQPILVLIAFGMSIIWIYLLCTQILNSLAALGAAWNIPNNILGITVLSWGNSIPDLLADTLVAMRGYPTMCTGSVFGGLNFILSIGIAFTFSPDTLSGGCYYLKPDPVVIITYLFLITQSMITIIVVPLSGWRFPKLYGVFLILFYVCYVVMSFLGTLYPPVKNAFTWKTLGCQ
ncbi:sodium/calcium exchanger [Acrasis kona]|uniref:Sodium/calcium exchanger n=1 Tax=Acrasis kona TaxID=1008807 RepID=A0AAW2ZMY9_9EUKA